MHPDFHRDFFRVLGGFTSHTVLPYKEIDHLMMNLASKMNSIAGNIP
jgi:hypothetical protein